MPDQDITGGAQVLGIVERAYRGAVEKQFFDVLYMSVELHRQLGGMDLLLRGPAVTCALRGAETGPLLLGGRLLDTLGDQRRDLRALIDSGVRVFVQEEDLTDLGFGPADLVDAAVRPVTSAQLTDWWPHYRMVGFL